MKRRGRSRHCQDQILKRYQLYTIGGFIGRVNTKALAVPCQWWETQQYLWKAINNIFLVKIYKIKCWLTLSNLPLQEESHLESFHLFFVFCHISMTEALHITIRKVFLKHCFFYESIFSSATDISNEEAFKVIILWTYFHHKVETYWSVKY